MPKKSPDALANLWYEALSTPFGIEVQCSPSYESVRTRLYTIRRELHDPDLDQISICQSPFDPDRAWLVKRNPTDEAA